MASARRSLPLRARVLGVLAVPLLSGALATLTTSAASGAVGGTVAGTVFRDYSADGARDALEPGEAGIVVTAYDSAGTAVGAATSAADGTYTVTVAGAASSAVRVEFAIPVAKQGYLQMAPMGVDSVGSVAFATLGATGVNVGVHNPTEYCQANPTLVTGCLSYGHQQGAVAATASLRSFPYAATGAAFAGNATATAAAVASHAQVGSTFALEWSAANDAIYSAAFHKQYAGYGPGGPGAVYRTVSGTTSVLATIPNAGTDQRAAYPVNATTGATLGDGWLTDSTFDDVGKLSLGDLALTDDETTLWVVNLNDRSLYPVTVATGAVGAPVAVPLAAGAGTACAAADVRPFALARHDGAFYLGETCSGQSTQQASALRLYVYRFDPVAHTFGAAPVFEMGMGGLGHGRAGNSCNGNSGTWRAWPTVDEFRAGQCAYPQPWLVSLAFDRGNLLLGIRDRFGDQSAADYPTGGGATLEGVIAGDLLRACGDPVNGWTLEANASCGGVTTAGAGNTQGPGGGEYYFQDRFATGTNHQETSNGGLLQLAGFPEVAHTVMDPDTANGSDWRAGGVHYERNDTGATGHWFQLYDKCDTSGLGCQGAATKTGMFGKASGLGDLVALCDRAPVEIGNRVWVDVDGNGRQDAGEPPLAGVPVTLYAADATTVLATVTTATDGTYAFSSDPTRTDSTGRAYHLAALTPGAHVIVHAPVTRTVAPYGTIGLTVAGAAVGAGRDSDVAVATGSSALVTIGGPGHNNHDIDIGYAPVVAPPPPPAPAVVGDHVWIDTNGNGVQDEPAASGVNGVTVVLQTAAGAPVTDLDGQPVGPVVTADADGAAGYYRFGNLPAGSYRVVFSNLPAGYGVTVADAGTDDAADSDGLTTAAVTVAAGGQDLTLDLGLVATPAPGHPLGSVAGVVFVDGNRNGQRDPGEGPLGGVVVELVDAGGTVVATTVTAADGSYRFESVEPGQYRLRQTQPDGYGSTTPDEVPVAVAAGELTNDPGFGEVPTSLPRTGAAVDGLARLAGALLAAGTLLVLAGRVPRRRRRRRTGPAPQPW